MNDRKWIVGAGGVILFLWALSMIRIIGTGHVGVVTQFGKVTGRELDPGISLVAPWPFQNVWVTSTQIQKEQADADAASNDLQQISTTVVLNYHLERGSISAIYQNIGAEYKARIIEPAIQEAVKATTAQYSASDLLTKRADVKEATRNVLNSRLKPRGIEVDDLSIVNFSFSDEFNRAIESKQVAQQDAERAQFNLQKAELDAKAQEVQKNSLTQEILTKQAIDKWDGHMPQYVGGEGSVFGIPLNK